MIGIYRITSPTGRIYIGQSKDILSRWRCYYTMNCSDQIKLYRSLKKHGIDRHKFEVIHRCRISQLNHWEKYYVDLFKSFNTSHGMNLRDGGNSGAALSKASIDKIKKARSKQSPPTLGKRWAKPKKKKRNRGEYWTGKTHKLKSRRLQALKKIGNKCHNKKVKRIDNGKVFNSVTDAADSIGIKMATLSRRINKGTSIEPRFTYNI